MMICTGCGCTSERACVSPDLRDACPEPRDRGAGLGVLCGWCLGGRGFVDLRGGTLRDAMVLHVLALDGVEAVRQTFADYDPFPPEVSRILAGVEHAQASGGRVPPDSAGDWLRDAERAAGRGRESFGTPLAERLWRDALLGSGVGLGLGASNLQAGDVVRSLGGQRADLVVVDELREVVIDLQAGTVEGRGVDPAGLWDEEGNFRPPLDCKVRFPIVDADPERATMTYRVLRSAERAHYPDWDERLQMIEAKRLAPPSVIAEVRRAIGEGRHLDALRLLERETQRQRTAGLGRRRRRRRRR